MDVYLAGSLIQSEPERRKSLQLRQAFRRDAPCGVNVCRGEQTIEELGVGPKSLVVWKPGVLDTSVDALVLVMSLQTKNRLVFLQRTLVNCYFVGGTIEDRGVVVCIGYLKADTCGC